MSVKVDPLEDLKNHPFVLAPMAGITDTAFRSFMREMGCGPVISELVSAHGIEHKSRNTMKIMKFSEDQRPVAIQLFGEDPEIVARAAQFVEAQGADWVDLNFGCPVPKVVNKGAGSAILKDLKALQKMLSTVKKAIGSPLTIKIRTGWEESSRNAIDVARIAYDEGITWVAIHGRTRAQGYSGQADWDYIGEVKAKSKIAIVGNGDIHTAELAVSRLRDYNLDGVMIGRGCLKNPWIFQQAHKKLKNEEIQCERDFIKAFLQLKVHLDRECDDKVMQIQLKKFAAWFSSGYPGSSNFRKNLFAAQTVEETILVIEAYFEALKLVQQMDTSHEAFLMGGHG